MVSEVHVDVPDDDDGRNVCGERKNNKKRGFGISPLAMKLTSEEIFNKSE